MTEGRDEGIYFPVNRSTDVGIPSVSADNVWHAGITAAEYAQRHATTIDDVVEMLTELCDMLKINAETVRVGLHPHDLGGAA